MPDAPTIPPSKLINFSPSLLTIREEDFSVFEAFFVFFYSKALFSPELGPQAIPEVVRARP
jgi:hypothetical protein